MPYCPTYPPCTLNPDNTVNSGTLLNPIVSVDSSKVVILGEKGEILVEYDRHVTNVEATDISPTRIIHYFIPTDPSSERLKQYTGSTVIMQLNNEDGSERLDLKLYLRR